MPEMPPEALARVLYLAYWPSRIEGYWDEAEPSVRESWIDVARAALAALTPAPAHVHGFSSATNAPPPPEPEGELVRVLVALSRGQNGQCWDRYGCRVNVHDDLCLLAQAALARARGQ